MTDGPARRRTVQLRSSRVGRRITIGLVVGGLVAASCASEASVPDGLAVSYVEVAADETWTSLAARLVPCEGDDPDPGVVDAVASYLQDTNPAIAEVGLADRQLVTFDPDRLPAECGTAGTADATSDPSDLAAAEPETSDEIDPTVETDETVDAAESVDDEPNVISQVDSTFGEPTSTDFDVAFSEAFDDPASLDRFQWQLHHGVSFGQSTFRWNGDHDDSCGKPTTTRSIEVSTDIILFPDGMGARDEFGDFVYWCAPGGDGTGHSMTSFDTEGYSQIAFAPDESFDDVRKVCWDQNQTDLGSRKWTQLVVVPEETYEANDRRLDYVSPAFQDGPGAAGVHLTESVMLFELNRGSTVLNFGQNARAEDFAGFTVDDKARRYTTCLTDLGNDTIEIALERDADTEIRTFSGSFPSGTVRVILQDDSYNPPKDPGTVIDPFTWHWDNITIETA